MHFAKSWYFWGSPAGIATEFFLWEIIKYSTLILKNWVGIASKFRPHGSRISSFNELPILKSEFEVITLRMYEIATIVFLDYALNE